MMRGTCGVGGGRLVVESGTVDGDGMGLAVYRWGNKAHRIPMWPTFWSGGFEFEFLRDI